MGNFCSVLILAYCSSLSKNTKIKSAKWLFWTKVLRAQLSIRQNYNHQNLWHTFLPHNPKFYTCQNVKGIVFHVCSAMKLLILKLVWLLFLGLGDKMKHGDKYYVTVTAINFVDKETYAFSTAIGIDSTAPTFGKVIDLHTTYRVDVTNSDVTLQMNAKKCDTDDGRVKFVVVILYQS